MQEHDIISFFHVIRNVYLLGKGEFYQVILDNLLSLTQAPAPESAAVDSLLKWRVLRASAKTLNLDDESLDTFLDLTSSSAGVTLTDFHCQSGLVHMTGDCVIEFMEPAVDKRDSSPKSSRLSFVAMCKVTDHKNIESRQATQWNREIFDLSIKSTPISPHDNSAWTEPALSVDKKLTELSRDSVHGCLSLEDEQVLGKGFFFHCLLRRCLSSSGKLAFMGDERRGDLVNQVSICFSREKLVLGQIFKDSSSYPASVVVRLQFYGMKFS